MVCLQCGSETQIINSRHLRRSNQVWRRRKCLQCQAVFTTREVAQYEVALLVRTPNGSLRPFLRDKLFLSLLKSCEHRKTALTDAAALADTVIGKLQPVHGDGIVVSTAISQVAQVALNRFDKAASVHYAAFHRT